MMAALSNNAAIITIIMRSSRKLDSLGYFLEVIGGVRCATPPRKDDIGIVNFYA